MLTFEVASFNIGYNYILERHFLLKFIAVIHTAYATINITGPIGVFTIKADQQDVLACENTSLVHVGRFGEKAAQEQATKATKIKGGSTPSKISASKTLISNSPRIPRASKGANIASVSIPAPTDQKVDNKLKGTLETEDKQVAVNPNNPDKKLWISDNLEPK
jgi:hypothetical protein